MNLEFEAINVSYETALGGDIVQVCFDENPDDDPLKPTSKSVSFSINYEFPPHVIQFEWCDGDEFDGGLEAINYSISTSALQVDLEDGSTIKVHFETDGQNYHKIESLLFKELGEPKKA